MRESGWRWASGPGSGSAVWATLTVAGLTALISAYAGLVTLLKIFGAAYLIWLAYRAFRSAATPAHLQKPTLTRGKKLYLQGIVIQLTNPKAALHWIAIVGIGLGNVAPLWVGLVLIAVSTALSLSVHVLYAVTFSTAPVIAVYRKCRRWIDGALGLFFSFAAYKIATYKP